MPLPPATAALVADRLSTEPLAGIASGQPEPPLAVVLGAAAVALALVLSRRAWGLARNAVTIAHEGGHAAGALLARRKLAGIRLHSDTSGVTLSRGRPRGFGMVLTAAAGYPAPALLGLASAALLAVDRITATLWLHLVLLLGMLVLIRNAFGVVSVLSTGAVVFAVSWFAPPAVQAAFAYLVAWFLLVGAVRPVLELQQLRARGAAPHSDADQLAGITPVPGLMWVLLFVLATVASAGLGGWLLLLS